MAIRVPGQTPGNKWSECRESCGKRDQKQSCNDGHWTSDCHRSTALVTLHTKPYATVYVSVCMDLCVY